MVYQLTEGQNYSVHIAVTNNSTKGGQPAAATLRVGATAPVGSLDIIAAPVQSYNFAPGEVHQFIFTMQVPTGTGGQTGSVVADVLDPAGNTIATGSEDISIEVSGVSIALKNPIHGPLNWDCYLVSLSTLQAISPTNAGISALSSIKIFPNLAPGQYILYVDEFVYAPGNEANGSYYPGPYLITVPGNGAFTIDESAMTFAGQSILNLATLPVAPVTGQFVGTPSIYGGSGGGSANWTGGFKILTATPGTAAAYFIGATISIYDPETGVPYSGDYVPLIAPGVTVTASLQLRYVGPGDYRHSYNFQSTWKLSNVSMPLKYPAQDYSFTGNMVRNPNKYYGGLLLTVNGNLSPFKVIIVQVDYVSEGEAPRHILQTLSGPLDSYDTGIGVGMNNSIQLEVWAHPDPNQSFSYDRWRIDHWSMVTGFAQQSD
ncbi:MAG: hypothetical protein ACYDHZ_00740 [Dehalococcoidia bacterium]